MPLRIPDNMMDAPIHTLSEKDLALMKGNKRICIAGDNATVVGKRRGGLVKIVYDDGRPAYLTAREPGDGYGFAEALMLSIIDDMTPAQLEKLQEGIPRDKFQMLLNEMSKLAWHD
jgi:hypothetical protein